MRIALIARGSHMPGFVRYGHIYGFVYKRDRIWENSYGICTRFQCAFLVAQINIYQSPDFVIYMSNYPSNLPSSTEASRAIQR